MPYIGRTLGQGTRSRFLYTATAGQTTFSGSDTQSNTLAYADNNGLDCFQNGVLLKGGGADYTATTGTSVVLTTGASVNDVIEILVYDVFAIADHVKKSGDAMTGALTNIDVNGTELILDADGDTSITADTDDQIDFKMGGTDRFAIKASGSTSVDLSAGSSMKFTVATSGGSDSHQFINNGTERMRIDSNGNVGIGASSVAAALHVIGTGLFTNTETSNTSSAFHFSNVLTNGAYRIRFDAANVVVGSIQVTTSGTVYNTSSDYRLKENVVTDWDATSRLKKLKPSRFNFKVDKDTTVDGFLAHEVSDIVPEAISGEKDAMTKEVLYVDGDEIPEGKKVGDVKTPSQIDPQGIDQSKLVPLLTKALQEAVAKIETLEAKVTALEGK